MAAVATWRRASRMRGSGGCGVRGWGVGCHLVAVLLSFFSWRWTLQRKPLGVMGSAVVAV
jgi:hypothetical protein